MSAEPPFDCFGGIILAAGLSRRMGQEDKLLKPLAGQPLILRALAPLTSLGLAQLILVAGAQADTLSSLLSGNVELCVNPRPADGMGGSLALGARLLRPELEGVFIVLGDMPFVVRDDYEKLVQAFRRAGNPQTICVPLSEGRRGHPVLFGESYVPALERLGGDEGARSIVQHARAWVVEVAGCSPGVLFDLDSPEAFAEAETRLSVKE